MIAIITGDIINSKTTPTHIWMNSLKKILSLAGLSPTQWEIFRGDSFQVNIEPLDALLFAIKIKACIKQHKGCDVRMAIGIGELDYEAKRITESNGEAYINSGECFEQLKKRTLAIKTPWPEFDEQINIILTLSLLNMNQWKPVASLVLYKKLLYLYDNQSRLTEILGKSQSTISEALKRSGFDELLMMNIFYQKQLNELC